MVINCRTEGVLVQHPFLEEEEAKILKIRSVIKSLDIFLFLPFLHLLTYVYIVWATAAHTTLDFLCNILSTTER
jgi:hypothetical protein